MVPMSDETKQESIPLSQRPRSPRVPVNFTVELEGEGAGGAPFSVSAEAVRVSRGGATLITDVEVGAGARVRLTPPFGRACLPSSKGRTTPSASRARMSAPTARR